jgi:hypothetical protein
MDAHGQALARHQPGDSGEAVELALTRANAIARGILAAPARNPGEVRAKAAALGWELQGEGPGAVLDAAPLDAIRGLVGNLVGAREVA